MSGENRPLRPWQLRLHTVIFEADTPGGRLFDVVLILAIMASVLVVMLASVPALRLHYRTLFYSLEWAFTLMFTVEYILRLMAVGRPAAYARSFYGIIDLLAILPTYVSLVIPGSEALLVIRLLRVLRIFRVLKLVHFIREASDLATALRASLRKILVFLLAVISIVVITGSVLYLVEGEENGFTSIPKSVYWAVVTLTTVGYGNITPQTPLGQFLAAVVMIMGYGIIAVPTGIVTAELAGFPARRVSTQACPQCAGEGHDPGARYCKDCGAELHPKAS